MNIFTESWHKYHFFSFLGEKMSEEEVDLLIGGMEDNQGQINYEGTNNFLKSAVFEHGNT